MAIQVEDNQREERFEIRVDGEQAGYAAYRREPGVTTFTHTEVDDSFEGQGLGSTLARAALDATRERGDRVVPVCPFIKGYIRKHPEYRDLLS